METKADGPGVARSLVPYVNFPINHRQGDFSLRWFSQSRNDFSFHETRGRVRTLAIKHKTDRPRALWGRYTFWPLSPSSVSAELGARYISWTHFEPASSPWLHHRSPCYLGVLLSASSRPPMFDGRNVYSDNLRSWERGVLQTELSGGRPECQDEPEIGWIGGVQKRVASAPESERDSLGLGYHRANSRRHHIQYDHLLRVSTLSIYLQERYHLRYHRVNGG